MRFLSYADLRTLKGVPYSKGHLRRQINAGKFPPPDKFPGGCVNVWREDVIDRFLADGIAEAATSKSTT
jgi:hypothetical protein